jgi:transcriptional regulator with XRE-family HTH domain
MDQASISRIENRKQPVTVKQLRSIADALEVPIEQLVSAA